MDGVSKQDIKNIIQLLILIVPIMALGFWGFLQSPMYKGSVEINRQNALIFYHLNYYNLSQVERDKLINKYDFTFGELNQPLNLEGIQ